MGKTNLPTTWATSPIVAAISFDGLISDGDWVESKDQDQAGLVRLIQLADIGDGEFKNKSDRFMTKESAAALNCTYLQEGDVLVARMPDPLGRACIFPDVGQPCVTVVDVCLIRTGDKSGISNKLLTYWINSPDLRDEIAANASGTTRKRITRKKLELFDIPIPPLAEQKVIADKLDTLLAQVDNTKARLERIPEILKSFRQSVLAAAVSGKLTEEWRTKFSYKICIQNVLDFKHSLIERGIVKSSKQDIPLPFDEELSEIPDAWVWSRLISVCSLITDGKHGNCKDESNSGFYFLSAKDVSNKKLVYENARQINQIEFKEVHQRTNLEPGDICIVNTGATVGKYAIAGDNEHTRNTTFQKSVAVVKVIKEYANNKFVAYYFEDATLRLVKASSGSAVNNLLLGTMKQLPIPLPPIEEQSEIVRRVEELFAFADRIEQAAQAAQSRVNHLTQSILAKAFRGELTAEWRAANPDLIRGDNSAEALLAKINSERAKLSQTKKGRSKSVEN